MLHTPETGKKRNSDPHRKYGFALVLSLVLMAFLSLFVITLAALVGLQLRMQRAALSEVKAKQAARYAAFQALAQMALRGELPESLAPAAVREAMTAVIRRTLNAPGTFDSSGWLRIGLCGHQPGLGENYISTGSLYLASAAFLPLGLPPENAFWSAPAEKWTSVRVWSGEDFPADHAVQG